MEIHVDTVTIRSAALLAGRTKLTCLLLSSLLLLFGGWAPAEAGSVLQVTKTQDTNDGVCDSDCSLREAILAANANPGPDTIALPVGRFTLTIPGSDEDFCATGDLDILGASVSITGQGPLLSIVDASGLGDRVFDVDADSAATVNLEALTVARGNCSQHGGGIYHNQGQLVLDNVVLRDNQSAAIGGGIYCSLGDLTVQGGSVIRDNSCSTQWYGGGIAGAHVTIIDSTVSGNLGGSGGGIANYFSGGTTTITGSTIAYNQTENYDGGGIYSEGSTITISNSTFVGNYSGRVGGAIFAGAAATVTLHSVTVSGNDSSTGDSLRVSSSGTMVLTNSLISGSCHNDGGTFSSSGGNLESPGNTCSLVGPGDDVNVADPMLGPLTTNGGPTMTRAPLLGSPAIDSGTDTACLSLDQRGKARSDGFCDVGSVERQATDQDPLFFDGFETGDTGAWSSHTP